MQGTETLSTYFTGDSALIKNLMKISYYQLPGNVEREEMGKTEKRLGCLIEASLAIQHTNVFKSRKQRIIYRYSSRQ